GMLMSAVTPMLYEIGEYNLAQEARGYGFGQVVRKYRSGVAAMERHDPTTLILLSALYEGLEARYPPQQQNQPQETVQQPPANKQPAKIETPITRAIAIARRFLVWILGVAKPRQADTNSAQAPVTVWQRPLSVTARASAPFLLWLLAVITGAR